LYQEEDWRLRQHNETAKRLGISSEELWKRKRELKIAWENGGGWESVRARLIFAEDFLARHKVTQQTHLGGARSAKDKALAVLLRVLQKVRGILLSYCTARKGLYGEPESCVRHVQSSWRRTGTDGRVIDLIIEPWR
jgi:hypothetical protein